MGRKFLKRIVINLPSTKDNEINVFHSNVKNHVPYTGPHKRFLIYYGLCFKQHILNCVSWFLSVILNFKAFYDAHTVERHYTVLLKSNRIFCLVLRIIFGNYFLMVSNEVEDHL